jgi:DNA ligase-1
MKVFEVLEKLEATSSRLEKEKILREEVDNSELKLLFVQSMDPYVTYGVAKFKMPPASQEEASGVLTGFVDVLNQLCLRQITGNKAKDKLESIFSEMTELQQKWLNRVLLKNLKIGCTSTTINKVWPKLIPTFEVQLAEEVATTQTKDAFTINDEVRYPCWVDPKLDGLRMIAIKRNGEVTLLSRNGQVFENFPSIAEALKIAEYDNVVLDGEVMGADWNESQSIAFSKSSKKSDSNMIYNVFDCLPLTDWVTQISSLSYRDRLTQLKHIVGLTNDKIRLVVGTEVMDEAHLLLYYQDLLNQGFEGVMLKDLSSPYQFKRTKAVRKLKPIATLEGVVSGWFLGHKNSKWEGKFGGFLVRLPNGVETRVGGGFSDEQRKQFMEDPNSHIDKVVECQCQPPLTADGKMRFPVFLRFRNEADVDPKVLG